MNHGLLGFGSPPLEVASALPLADIPPTNPSPENDEFDDPFKVLASKWAISVGPNTLYSVNKTWPSWLRIRINNDASGNVTLRQAFTPQGNFSYTVKFCGSPQVNYNNCQIELLSSDENDVVDYRWEYSTGMSLSFATRDAGVWNYARNMTRPFGNAAGINGPNTMYLHIQREAANLWKVAFSTNGHSWQVSYSYTKAFTVAKVLLSCWGGAGIFLDAGIDWVRRDWTTI